MADEPMNSGLFENAMAAATVGHASGCGPTEPSNEPNPRDGLCNHDFDFCCYPCDLPQGHEGRHLSQGDDWEIRWT